ncbi:MAG: DUF748 domain-containing protein [Puniceicoccaceae bacterium]
MSRLKEVLFGTRRRKWLTFAMLVVGLYAIIGFLLVPGMAKPRIVEEVAKLTGREVVLEKLAVNPFTLSATFTGFTIKDTDGEVLLSLGRLKGNLQLFGFLFREIHFKEVDLVDPYFRIQIQSDGSLNIADILNQVTGTSASQPEESNGWHLKVGLLRVVEGNFSFTDLSRSTPFRTSIAPISFDIAEFHTSGESDAPYSFSATSESGESLSWEGFVALAPVRSKGSLQLDHISMPKYEPYYDIVLNTDIISGKLHIQADYEYSSGASGTARVADASASFENLEIVDSGNRSPVITIAQGSIEGLQMDQASRSAEVKTVRLSSGEFLFNRLEDGSLDLLQHVKSTVWQPESTGEVAEPTESMPPLAYQVEAFSLEDFSLQFVDRSIENPVTLAMDKTSLKLRNINSTAGSEMDIEFNTSLRTGGTIASEGKATLSPLGGDLSLALGDIELGAANPYIAEFVNLTLQGGKLNLQGQSRFAIGEQGPSGRFLGNLWLNDFAVIGEEPLVSFSRLDISAIEASYNETALDIGEIILKDAQATVLINEDGISNLAALSKDSPEEVEPKSAGAGLGIPFPVTIGRIVIENAGASVIDRQVSPSVNLGLESLSGTVAGLSSEELARADLDLKGKLSDGTQLAVSGEINPLQEDRFSDVTVRFDGFNLTEVSPYSAKFTGYPLSKGKLSFDLSYQISQAQLSGENLMTIDQLTLGEKVPSEDAVNLPVPLAVSLLKDSKGVIEIDVPVSGDLNDPEFSFGRVIGRALFNLITKLVTSPFSILGGLVPGGGEMDLSQVAFLPGSTSLDEQGLETLNVLATALRERPNLNLEIIGRAGGIEETETLKRTKLENTLRSLRLRELESRGRTSRTLEEIELTPEERNRFLEKLYYAMFPSGTPTTEPASPVGNVPEPEPDEAEGFGIRTFIRNLFGGDDNGDQTEVSEAVTEVETETPAEPAATDVISPSTMETSILEAVEIEVERLQELANLRAATVRTFLEQEASIPTERLFVVIPEDENSIHPEAGSPSVAFRLE